MNWVAIFLMIFGTMLGIFFFVVAYKERHRGHDYLIQNVGITLLSFACVLIGVAKM